VATLKDIAKKSGVSVGTASAVINNKSWVSDKTRKRVWEVIEQLNYRPNQTARSLKIKKSETIGLIVSDITNPFFPEIVRSIEGIARNHGYSLILCDANEDIEIGLESFNLLFDKQVDGMILLGGIVPQDALLSFLKKKNFPLVVVERDYGYSRLNTILVDAVKGAFTATTHLLNLGYWPVGIISGPLSLDQESNYLHGSVGRFEGYQAALKAKGIPFDKSWVKEGDFRFEGGYRAMMQFLEQVTVPRAVFVSNDLMAIGAMEAIKNKGLRIPEDIAIVGYDDIPEASYTSPTLTTIALPKRKLGTLAIEILLKSLSGQENEYQKVVLPTKLVVRESCGAQIQGG